MGEATDYTGYLGLDQLLSAQAPHTDRHDETLFIIIHQTTELWLKQILHELDAAIGWLEEDALDPAQKALARISRVQALITQSWDVLATLTPPDYLTFRHALGSGSGFQSEQFRRLEFRLGLKDRRYLASFADGSQARARLEAALAQPSVYDAALGVLARRSLTAAPVVRDHAPEPSEAIEEAWLGVYRNPSEHWDLYELAEKLVDLEDAFRTWRFRHVTTVERVIGRKRGTGGTTGVDYLLTGLEKRCFPELWSLRTKL